MVFSRYRMDKKNKFYFIILLLASILYLLPVLFWGISDERASLFFYIGIAIVVLLTRNMWVLLFYFLIIALNMYLTYLPCAFIGVTVTSIINLYSILCLIVLLIKHKFFTRIKKGMFANFLLYIFASLCLYCFNGYINSTGVTVALWRLSPLFMSLALVIILKDHKELQDVFLISVVVAAIIFVMVAYIELLQGSTFFYHLWTNDGERYRNGIMRVGSTLGDPNTLAMYSVPVVFLILTKRCKSIFGSNFCKYAVVALTSIVVLSSSRMSLIALCSGFVFWLWFNGKSKYQIIALILFLGVVILAPILLPQIYNLDYASSGQRTMLVIKAVKIWQENVFFGIGLDNFLKRTYWMTMNEYARQLVELGVFGFFAYLSFYYIFFAEFFRFSRKKKSADAGKFLADGALIFGALIAFAINSISMESYFHYIMWIFPSLFYIFLNESNDAATKQYWIGGSQ